jgi:hypothetical protein
MNVIRLASGTLAAAETWACGGFLCDPDIPAPPSQSSERIVFVVNPAGHDDAPDGLVASWPVDPGDPPPEDEGSVDAYIEVAYAGSAGSFAWVVPVLRPPLLVGTAGREMIDEIDRATAPLFHFTVPAQIAAEADSAGPDCDCLPMADDEGSYGDDDFSFEPQVTVLGKERVGPYEVAVVQSDRSSDLWNWLAFNGYALPVIAEDILQAYVTEQKTFVAFRLADGEGLGAIQPVVLRVPGGEPCIPLRLTRIATQPVLDVTAIVLADGLVETSPFGDASVDHDAVRPTSPTETDYALHLRDAVVAAGGRAFQTEFATAAHRLEVQDAALVAMRDRSAHVTRLATRIAAKDMVLDPIFTVTERTDEVFREHWVDISGDPDAQDALFGYLVSRGGVGGRSVPAWALGFAIVLARTGRRPAPRARAHRRHPAT